MAQSCLLQNITKWSVFSSSRNPLKFTVEEVTDVQLYPETDEPVNILNIKRGIVSALMVPVMEDEQSSLMVSVAFLKGKGGWSKGKQNCL